MQGSFPRIAKYQTTWKGRIIGILRYDLTRSEHIANVIHADPTFGKTLSAVLGQHHEFRSVQALELFDGIHPVLQSIIYETSRTFRFGSVVVATGLEPVVSLRSACFGQLRNGRLAALFACDAPLLSTPPPRCIPHCGRSAPAPHRCERCALPSTPDLHT